MAFLRSWLVIWGLVTGVSLALAPVLGAAPLPVRTLVISGVVVAVMR